jgi:hypothetical protein|tara:strand:- start:50 stop:427 length:378 start_codon:yes stop_codon:yes gene_type:complete
MINEDKYYYTHISRAILALTNVPCNIDGEIKTEEDWNTKVKFRTGIDENNVNIWSTDKPEGITYAAVKAKQDELQAEYDAQDYARKRKAEYPTIEELVVALYDTEDKTAIDSKRAEIKLKYPKPE